MILFLVGLAIALGSIGGAAYLLRLWHDDAELIRSQKLRVTWRTWPFSRVLAYVAVTSTLASNFLLVPTAVRLLNVEHFREIQAALTPLTIASLLVLDSAFVIVALYLRAIRRRK